MICALSFDDARPRGASDIHYVERDEFHISDLVAALTFTNGELHLDTDYVRGRRMKTRVVVRRDGTATINTIERVNAALRWIARLKGEKLVRSWTDAPIKSAPIGSIQNMPRKDQSTSTHLTLRDA